MSLPVVNPQDVVKPIGPQANEPDVTSYKMESLHAVAFFSALAFAVVAVVLSVHLIIDHFLHYNRPSLQRHVYRILLMCPIYACISLLGLGLPRFGLWFDVVRDSYEAFTVFSFVKYLIAVLGGEREAILQLARKPQIEMLFPLNHILSKPWQMGAEMVYKCKYSALQYVIIKPLCAVIVFISESADIYGEGEWRFDRTYPLVAILSNASQILAVYGLAQLFYAAREELEPWSPVPKFLSVKAVVFFTFWQGVALSILVQLKILVSLDKEFTSEMLQVTLQNWLVCLEMCIVALYHHIAFPVKEYQIEGEGLIGGKKQKKSLYGALDATNRKQVWENFQHSMAVHDVVDDMDAFRRLEGIQAQKVKPGLASVTQQLLQQQQHEHGTKESPRVEGAEGGAAEGGGEGGEGGGGDGESSGRGERDGPRDPAAQQRWKTGLGKLQERLRPQ